MSLRKQHFSPHVLLPKSVNFRLSLTLCYSLKIRTYGMIEKKMFCIYGYFSISRYIEGGRKYIFRHNWIFRDTLTYKPPTLAKQWNYGTFVQIWYCYFKYTDMLFLACALFVTRCNICSALWEPKKKRLSYRKKKKNMWEKHHFFNYTPFFLCHFCVFLRLLRNNVLTKWLL